MSERVHPFSSGSQFADWQSRNCDRCTKYDPEKFTGACEIDGAMFDAYLGDGSLSPEIAARMGYVQGVAFWLDPPHPVSGEPGFAYTWDCPELEARETPAGGAT